MTEIPSSSDYLQMKKWKLLNKSRIESGIRKHAGNLFSPPNEESYNEYVERNHNYTVQNKNIPIVDIHKEIFANKLIVLLNRYNEKFIAGKYDELIIKLRIKKVTKLVKRINNIVPGNKNISTRDKPICLRIIKTLLANLNIIVNHLHLHALFKNTKEHLNSLEKSTAEVLGNKGKLLQYLKEMSAPAIMPLVITAPLLHIRHEYIHYHKRYGIPDNLNYDLGKLNKIILEHDF